MEPAHSLFDLTPTQEQQMTRDVVRRFASEELRENARAADEAALLPDGFLAKTLELGLNFMPIPEDLGGVGAGRSAVSNVLVIEDLACGDMSMAIATLAPLSVINCLLEAGTDKQQANYFHQLAAESFVPASMALLEPGLGFNPRKLSCKAVRGSDGNYRLNGEKSMVCFGDSAQLIVTFAELEGEGVRGFIIEKDTAGVSFAREDYMGLRPLPAHRMQLSDVVLGETQMLRADMDYDRLLNMSRIATAALAVGTCQGVLDYVVPYVNERVAFGEPISHRQAVAFMVADMATEIEAMRLMVYRAAAQLDQGLDATQLAFLAQRNSVRHGMKIGTDGVQLLGGHGFIREHPVEMWYRNLRALATLDGVLLA